jgi:hypothetical protein
MVLDVKPEMMGENNGPQMVVYSLNISQYWTVIYS